MVVITPNPAGVCSCTLGHSFGSDSRHACIAGSEFIGSSDYALNDDGGGLQFRD